jgi:hypothetical protein
VYIGYFLPHDLAKVFRPANLSYSDVRETKAHIHWHPPELYELFHIKRYHISYTKHAETVWYSLSVTANGFTDTNAQLDNLESDTFYAVIITAENKRGRGMDSKQMDFKTLKAKGNEIFLKIISKFYAVQSYNVWSQCEGFFKMCFNQLFLKNTSITRNTGQDH